MVVNGGMVEFAVLDIRLYFSLAELKSHIFGALPAESGLSVHIGEHLVGLAVRPLRTERNGIIAFAGQLQTGRQEKGRPSPSPPSSHNRP